MVAVVVVVAVMVAYWGGPRQKNICHGTKISAAKPTSTVRSQFFTQFVPKVAVASSSPNPTSYRVLE